MSFHLNPWYWLTLLGTPEMWVGIAVGLGVLSSCGVGPTRRTWLRSFLGVFAASMVVVFVLVLAVKAATVVPRPCGAENPYCEATSSFPSGHAATAFAAFTSLLLFAGRRWLPLAVLPALVAGSRVALGVHTPLDVVAGAAVGSVVPVMVARLLGREGSKGVFKTSRLKNT